MIEFDEKAVVEFLGVMPSGQAQEEGEVFWATFFDLERDDFRLHLTVSRRFEELMLQLTHLPSSGTVLSMHLRDMKEVCVERVPGGGKALLCRAVSYARTATSERAPHTITEVWIYLSPTISVNVETRHP
jgi:hypothetical protein